MYFASIRIAGQKWLPNGRNLQVTHMPIKGLEVAPAITANCKKYAYRKAKNTTQQPDIGEKKNTPFDHTVYSVNVKILFNETGSSILVLVQTTLFFF